MGMSAGDLGMLLGVIIAPIVALEVYQSSGLWTAIGVFAVGVYVIGFAAGAIIGLISSQLER